MIYVIELIWIQNEFVKQISICEEFDKEVLIDDVIIGYCSLL